MGGENKMIGEQSEKMAGERRPEIAEQISFCHKRTEELGKIIGVLIGKLEPILRNDDKEKGEEDGKCETPRFTELGSEIRKIGQDVDFNVSRIEEVLGRLEI